VRKGDGQPVADLVSRREFERLRGKRLHFSDAYRKFLETHALEEIDIEDDFASPRVTGRPDARCRCDARVSAGYRHRFGSVSRRPDAAILDRLDEARSRVRG